MRFFRKSLIGLFMWAVAIALLAFAADMISMAVQEKTAKPARPTVQKERIFAVNVQTATLQTMTPLLTAFGEVDSARTLELRFARGGQVSQLAAAFIDGGLVAKDEVLVKLDDATLQSALARATADMLDAQNEVTNAERAMTLAQDELAAAMAQAQLRQNALTRQEDLSGRGVGTSAAVEAAALAGSSAEQAVLSRRSAVDQAAVRKDQAQTKLTRAQLSVQDATRQRDEATRRAEFSGTLTGVT
ncbi:MAG: efflux transporter periplasmic adaptor subunit, partial [Paracoccaceae bacterium]|nr:efflux transporter periplasmic adaptor subunit [Paracoccaceae bacterium]